MSEREQELGLYAHHGHFLASLGHIRDVLRSLGHEIGRTTIQEILKEHGLEPAPRRKRQQSWSEVLQAHWGAIAACDFFTVEVMTLQGLVRYHVFIVIDLASRRVEIGGIVRQPTGEWMVQVARNILDVEDGFVAGKTHLIMDRDPLFARDFCDLLASSGVEPVRLHHGHCLRASQRRSPARSPNLNAYAERCILSIKSECDRAKRGNARGT